jgi:hypothetical protein
MSKRSDFKKVPKDFYPTTDKKVLVDVFLRDIQGKTYAEPCWGEGDLEDLLRGNRCLWRSDLRDTSPMSKQMDGLKVTPYDVRDCDLIVTNPPFSKDVLLPLIDHWITLKPTWLLLPADLMHNKYFGPYMEKCAKVVSIGRICWFPAEGKRVASTDNFCWYFWEKDAKETTTVFVGK